jgi:hypothetical protein
MLTYDKKNKQILTSICRSCPDEYFVPKHPSLLHVGCCSYSPVFTLFEIHKMLKENQKEFFIDEIYYNDSNTIRPFDIVIHSTVHSLFDEADIKGKSTLEIEDIKLGYSVCQFFKVNKGCSLHPPFKTSVCRSFICSTIEESLSEIKKQEMLTWVKGIRSEAEEFNLKHQAILQEQNLNLINNLEQVLNYLENE